MNKMSLGRVRGRPVVCQKRFLGSSSSRSSRLLQRSSTKRAARGGLDTSHKPIVVARAIIENVVGDKVTKVERRRRDKKDSFVKSFLQTQDQVEGDIMKQFNISERYWDGMKSSKSRAKVKTVVEQVASTAPQEDAMFGLDYDVCICGGNLGIAIALALQKRGHRVLIVERRLLRGRTQEWNASRKEMRNLVKTGLLTEKEIEDAIISDFNPNRVTFKEGKDMWVNDILNIGVAPDKLIRNMKERFLENGGAVRELCEFKSAKIYDDMAVLKVKNLSENRKLTFAEDDEEDGLDLIDVNKPNALPTDASFDEDEYPLVDETKETITCSLIVDCMGHFSPIVKQLRKGEKPESIVLVVGGCATEGVPKFTNSDILASFSDAEHDMQNFWETFPAKDGTTMYMFTYCDADESRVSFEDFLGSFLKQLPEYCEERLKAGQAVGIDLPEGSDFFKGDLDSFLADLKFNRLLFGAFPSYKKCPLNSPFDRLVMVGDSSAVQSPLSFGGFGAMLRHLPRLDEAIHEALEGKHLKAGDLELVQPYMPALSAAWLFQKAMGFEPSQMGFDEQLNDIPEGSKWTKSHINRVLAANFSAMEKMDDKVLLSFLQDTIMFGPLSKTMFQMMFEDPVAIFRVVYLLGPRTLAEWFVHYILLGFYSFLDFAVGGLREKTDNYYIRRYMDAWHYGSGSDFEES